MNLSVDIISDVICPWCYIGKRRLEKAIAASGRQVQVRWLPLQLNPTMPKEGILRRDYRIKKFGSWERSPRTLCPGSYCPGVVRCRVENGTLAAK